MASRIDAVQVALPRAVDGAAQQHAAQRQPVVAQEQVTQTVRQENVAREQRPEALQRRGGREVRNDLVKDALDQEAGTGGRPRRRPGATASGAGQAAAPGATPEAGRKPSPPPDGKGLRVDVRL